MFSSLIGTLTSFLPKNFIFSSLVPVLIFGFVNLALAYVHVTAFRTFAEPQIGGVASVFVVAVAFVAAVVAAYLLSAISNYLREVLEGRHLWPPLLRRLFVTIEIERRNTLDATYEEARNQRSAIGEASAPTAPGSRGWFERMAEARRAGSTNHPGAVAIPSEEPAFESIRKLERRAAEKRLTLADLSGAVDRIADVLARYDATADPALDALHVRLVRLIQDAERAWLSIEVLVHARKEALFGQLDTAPTRMGNITRAMQNFADTRYQMNLDTFWSRLQPVIEKSDPHSSSSLVEAKTQLDFLVACCWLCALTTVGWLVALGLFGDSPWMFLAIAVIGPIAAYFFYFLAWHNYRAYAAVVRASIDLNRFALLTALHIPLPATNADEKATWSTLRDISTFGDQQAAVTYEHPAAPAPAPE